MNSMEKLEILELKLDILSKDIADIKQILIEQEKRDLSKQKPSCYIYYNFE